MNKIFEIPEMKNCAHLEKVQEWYGNSYGEIKPIKSDEIQSIFLVLTNENRIEIARVFTNKEIHDISIDFSGSDNYKDFVQMLITYEHIRD